MSKSKPQLIPKPLLLRLHELIQSMQVLSDSLDGTRSGKLHQLLPLYGQLRALLAERRRGNQSLLVDICEQLSVTSSIYAMPGVDNSSFPNELKEGLRLHLAGFPITTERVLPKQNEMSLTDLLTLKMLFYNGNSYTIFDVVKQFAEHEGGAHYATRVPIDFAELAASPNPAYSGLRNCLAQLGGLVLQYSLDVIKNLVDFDIYLILGIPSQKLEKPGHLFDSQFPNTRMRITCIVTPQMKLGFAVSGYDGRGGKAQVERIIDWSTPHALVLSCELRSDLRTRLSIVIDGKREAELEVPFPLLVLNESLNYETFHNRSVESADNGLWWGLSEMFMVGRAAQLTEKAQAMLYLHEGLQESSRKCVVYETGSYAHAPPGCNDLKMTGSVQHTDFPELMNRGLPKDDGSGAES